MARRKHIPQRMCVACRESQDKNTLVRIVRTPDGILIDETGKLSGRGAYLHPDPTCWEQGLQKSLEKSLNVDFTNSDRSRLNDYLANLRTKADQDGKSSV